MKEVCPLKTILEAAPASPEADVTCNPAAVPANASIALIAFDSVIISESTFWTAYPSAFSSLETP